MQIHNNLSNNSAVLAAFQNQRPAAGAAASQTPAAAASEPEASAADQTQDAGWEIQDAQGADQVMASLRQSMTDQPSSTSLLHSQSLLNAFSLLQPDEG